VWNASEEIAEEDEVLYISSGTRAASLFA
jgi:hypothetical protein